VTGYFFNLTCKKLWTLACRSWGCKAFHTEIFSKLMEQLRIK